jgi:hypothetical protein
MADPSERYCLRRVQSAAQWAAYHAIRRDAIFAPLLPGQAYDESGPDEHRPGRLAHVLLHDGQVVGTVADRPHRRNPGRPAPDRHPLGFAAPRPWHRPLALAEQTSRGLGRTDIIINAHPTSLTFYLANGYAEGEWHDTSPVPPGLIRVGKRLR